MSKPVSTCPRCGTNRTAMSAFVWYDQRIWFHSCTTCDRGWVRVQTITGGDS